jgi:hypothetical protein
MWRFTYLRDVVHCKPNGKRLRNTKKNKGGRFSRGKKTIALDLATNSTFEVNIEKPCHDN